MIRKRLVVMLKEPRPGRVKTRLAQDIGAVAAAGWYRHQSLSLIRRLRDPRWDLILAVTPDHALHSRVWPQDLPRCPQGRGDLGLRMRRHLAGPGPACVIGSDIPGITRAHVARAFQRMRGADGVFGPAEDGGYWLVGWRNGARLPVGLFADVRWSGPYALADSMASAPDALWAMADRLRDVDRLVDLKRL